VTHFATAAKIRIFWLVVLLCALPLWITSKGKAFAQSTDCTFNLGTGQSPGTVNTASDPIWRIIDIKTDVDKGPAVLVGTPTSSWSQAPQGLHWIATRPGPTSGGDYPPGDYYFYTTFKGDQGVLSFSVAADNEVKVYLNDKLILDWGTNGAGFLTPSPMQYVTTGLLPDNNLTLVVHNRGSFFGDTAMGVLFVGGFDRSLGNPALIQSTFGKKGNFEVVVPYPDGGIAHYYRDNDQPATPWIGPTAVFGPSNSPNAPVGAVSMIQNYFGNLEVVARIGTDLYHFYRDSSSLQWHETILLTTGVSGTPSLIQDTDRNFEVVTPLLPPSEGGPGGIAHLKRNNSAPGNPWGAVPVTGSPPAGVVDAVSLIQSSYAGELEVVARIGEDLFHFYRNSSGWHGTGSFTSTSPPVSGTPSLIQASLGEPGLVGSQGNFEVVTPLATGGMADLFRNNMANFILNNQLKSFHPWYEIAQFGSGNVSGASLIQSNYTNLGVTGFNLEVVANVCKSLYHYYYNGVWSGPTTIVP
jgi:hypothetical protein